jgi:endonuclease-3
MAGKPVVRIIELIASGLGYDRRWKDSRLMNWEQPGRRRRRDPFRSLIGTVLSARTRDENTARAAEQLFAKYGTPEKLARAPLARIRKLIKPAGFYRVKAGYVRDIARIIAERNGGRVPDSMEGLLELPGVGRKVAGCVLVYAFGKPAIPVDTHVHRTVNRIGIVKTGNPDQTEQALMKAVPRRYWLAFNDLFVQFGKQVCKPIGPLHDGCPVNKYCDYYKKVYKSRLRPSA